MFRSISDWSDKDGSSITEDEFFLRESEFRELYINKGKNSQKVIDKPIEQLSPKGLAIMSYIYSQHDNSEAQPIIASTVNSFEHMVKLVANSPPGTSVTVIFQPTDGRDELGDYYGGEFAESHKTVCKLEKVESGLRVIHMDSTYNSLYGEACKSLAVDALKGSRIRPEFYFQRNPVSPSDAGGKTFSRQNDGYQCGVFALKDARQLNRDKEFSTNMVLDTRKNDYDQHYVLPASYLKGMQSREFSEHVLREQGGQIVTRKGKTLQQTHDKYNVSGYVHHFSQKYYDSVAKFLDQNKDNPKMIRESVERYDAEKMTLERLISVYTPKSVTSTDSSTASIISSKDPENTEPALSPDILDSNNKPNLKSDDIGRDNDISTNNIQADSLADHSEVCATRQVTKVLGYTERSQKFLSEDNTNKIKDILCDEGLKISGNMVNQTNNDKLRNVFSEKGEQKFKIHINKLTTQKFDVETFVVMLKVFQAVHGNVILPAITTNSEQAKELWKTAMNKVYPGQESNLDSAITVKIQAASKSLSPVVDGKQKSGPPAGRRIK